jgi:hypothetical protein
VIGTIAHIAEHHEGLLLLIRNDKIGSAFAIVRSIVDPMTRNPAA